MNSMVIDSHLHLDDSIDGSVETAAKAVSDGLNEAGINWGLALHLNAQPWSVEEFSKAIQPYDNIKAFVNVEPKSADACDVLDRACRELGFIGLKLHPRLQNFQPNDREVIELCQFAGKLNVPVLIDAFPDGTALINGFNTHSYAELAIACPNTKFIWAHMGAHYVLEFMLMAKRLENVYFDCSYSLLYFRGSHVPQDMVYAMKSMRFDRIFYGSDYPDRSLKDTLQQSIEVFKKYDMNEEQLGKVLFENANMFFSSFEGKLS